MRAKVASKAGGHAFEKRFLDLTGLQLEIAYRQAMREEKEDTSVIKTLNEVWSKKFDNLFKVSYMFSNPDMYKNYEQMKEMEGLREEVKVEEFPDLWEDILSQVPGEIVVDDPEEDDSIGLPKVDDETEQMLTGFVPFQSKKEGDQ